MPAAELTSAFRAYGDAGRHWTGGSCAASVALPDGRVVWLFSAVFLGSVDADGSRPASSPLISNAMVVQTGPTLGETRHGGPGEAPEALATPDREGEFLGVGDAVVESGELRVIHHRYRRGNARTLDFVRTGVALVRFALPSLDLISVTDLPFPSDVSWGSAITPDGEYTYVYGTASAPGRMKFAHVARVVTGALDGPWQFWTGSAWSPDPAAAGRLLTGVGTGFSVRRAGSEYVLVTQETNLVFDPQLVAYRATSPTGPFTGPVPLYTAPEAAAVTTTGSRAGLLIPGHRYEFKVSAVDAAGEGPASATGTVTPQSARTAAEVIGGAGSADAVADSYIARLNGEGAQPERVAAWSEQIVAQAGGTLDSVFVAVLQGFAATITEAQAINLAAHPDILDVEQNATSYLLD